MFKEIKIKNIMIIGVLVILLTFLVFAATYFYNYYQAVKWPEVFAPTRLTQKPVYLFSIKGDAKSGIQMYQPMAVTVNRGKIYVSDSGNHRILAFYPNGQLAFAFGKQGSDRGEFDFPYGMVFLDNGEMWVSDPGNRNIQAFNSSGEFKRIVMDKDDGYKPGAMIQKDGFLYVSDMANHQVLILNKKGKVEKIIKDKEVPVSFPQGLAFDDRGSLYVGDAGNFRIQIIDEKRNKCKGVINGGNSGRDPFSLVRGLAVDILDRVFVADTLSNRIRVFDMKGKELFYLSKGGALGETLAYPVGLTIDERGLIYITEWGNNQVQVWGYPVNRK